MDHFNDCISKNKGARQQAIQVNIFTAFLAALKVKCRPLLRSVGLLRFYFATRIANFRPREAPTDGSRVQVPP